ncbi:MAG: hypothetical protein QMD21_03465 [Candidatus Thermoplasmatota archaeon]|nr:hypothetical protein [Candidatus Thermoplasmatota archaeon]
MISEPLTQIKSADKVVWMTRPARSKEVVSEIIDYTILSLATTVFKKLSKEKASEILMNAAELLGSKVYDEFVTKKITTPQEWCENINELIFEPMGTTLKWVKVTDDSAEVEIFECPTLARALAAPEIVCPFSYGFGRALWRKSFPEGDLKMRGTIALGMKGCNFQFIKKSSESMREDLKRMMQQAVLPERVDVHPKPLTEFTIRVGDYAILALTDSIFGSLDKNEASEVVITAAEELGRLVFEKRVGKKIEKYTPMDWARLTSGYIWNLQGTGIVFSEISDEKIVAHIFKCPTPERAGKSPHIACPFSWGYARGVWKSIFSEGEVLMGGTMAHGAPTCQFFFYVKAGRELSEERERVRRYLTKEEELRLL